MRKKVLLTSLLALMLFTFLTLISTVKAAEPTYNADTGYVLNGSQKCFFANGTEISIMERTDGQEGATIFWAEGTKNVNVPNDINVFGGGHKDTTIYDNTKITMNGGKVKNIFGGGLHESYVTTSNIIVNGGTITGSITGGGANVFANSDYCVDSNIPAENSLTKVTNSNVTINNGSSSTVFGGGEGNSYTGNATVKINGGNFDYVTAGGSNGYTGNSSVKVTSGTIGVLQSVNRGVMTAADVRVSGGTIKKLYVGGETDPSVTGKIDTINLDITGGTVVENLYLGTSGGQTIGTNGNNTKTDIDIYFGATVHIANEAEFANIPVTTYIFVTINDTRYELEKGKTLADLAELSNIKNVNGKEFVKFVKKDSDETFEETNIIDADIELQAIYTDKVVETVPEAPKTEKPKDDTPKTGIDNTIDILVIAIGMSSLLGIAVACKIKE